MTAATEPSSPTLSSEDQQLADKIIQNIKDIEENVSTNMTTANESWGFDQLLSLIDAGGFVIIVLIAMSIISMSVFLLKLTQFLIIEFSGKQQLINALTSWQAGKANTALNTLKNTSHPIARVLEVTISLRSQQSLDDALVREEVMRIAKRQLAKAKSYMRILEVTATLSPLLGLLGTVLGMITAFQKLQGAGAAVDPSILSGGIWEALLTTAAGLIVAIPTVLGLNWLEQKIEKFKLTMEDCMTQAFTIDQLQLHHNMMSKQIQLSDTLQASIPSEEKLTKQKEAELSTS